MGQEMELPGHLCAGAGTGDLHCRYLSGRVFDVFGRLAPHRLRLGLHPKEVKGVKIVVWRSPKALGSVLRLLFGIKDAQE